MRTKTWNKSLLLFAITTIMLFAMSITASAASSVGTVTQTGGDDNSVAIAWTQDTTASAYNVYYSTDGVTYGRKYPTSTYDVSNPDTTLYSLSAGTTYYVYVVPVVKDENYNYVEQTDKKSDVVSVVTAPAQVDNNSITQTAASSSSVSFTWTGVAGATGYNILDQDGNYIATVAGTEATVSMTAGTYCYFKVQAVRTDAGYTATGSASSIQDMYTAPGQVINLGDADSGNLSWTVKSNKITNKVTVGWDKNSNDTYTPDGYQVEIYSINGKKKLKTYTITKQYETEKTFNIKSVKDKGFKIRVAGYKMIGNTAYYGDWSDFKTVVPQARISIKKASKTSLKIKWAKVANATSYTIYVCKNGKITEKSAYKKVKKVGKNVRSYTVKNLKKGKYAAIYVIPTVKVKGKTYKAQATWYYSYYMSSY